jgi:hypothetical protein
LSFGILALFPQIALELEDGARNQRFNPSAQLGQILFKSYFTLLNPQVVDKQVAHIAPHDLVTRTARQVYYYFAEPIIR